jgi:hypothetical protein
MRKRIALALAGLAVAASAYAGDADFTLVNRTGYDIREVYISPAHSNNWGRDRMGDGVLENGKGKRFAFSDHAACKQDIQVVFDDDGSKVTWENVDLCELEKITIKYNRSTREVSATGE